MSSIRQHIPAYYDPAAYEPKEAEFSTLDELLAIPWVKSWSERSHGATSFHRYSVADIYDNPSLMAEHDDGYEWWVIGFLTLDEPLDLPEWKAKYRD